MGFGSAASPRAGDNDSSDFGWRELPCGCWQRWLHGDIVTSADEAWVTVVSCAEHAPLAALPKPHPREAL